MTLDGFKYDIIKWKVAQFWVDTVQIVIDDTQSERSKLIL